MNQRKHGIDELEQELPLDIWQRLSRVVLVLLFFALIAVIMALFWPELRKQQEFDRRIAALEALEAEKQVYRDDLKQEYQWLQSDTDYVEIKARDRLGMRMPDEQVANIVRKTPAEAAAATADETESSP